MMFFKKSQDNKPNDTANPPPDRNHDSGASTTELNGNRNSANITINDDETLKHEQPFMAMLPGDKVPNQGKMMLYSFIGLLFMMLIEVGIPLALYYGLRNTIGVLYALVISGIPPFLYVIFVAIRKRRIDVLGCIIGVSFILSGVVSIVSGDERAALIRDSAVAAVIGGMFLVTLVPIRTKWLTILPLNYIIAQQMMAEVKYRWTDKDGNRQEQNVISWQWDHIRYFRISMYMQTAAWGVLLVLELMACILMVQSDMTVDEVVMYNNILTSTVVAVMISASIAAGIYGHMIVKRVGKKWGEENDFTEKYESRRGDNGELRQRNIGDEQDAASMV